MKTETIMLLLSLISLQASFAQDQDKNLFERGKQELALVDEYIMI